MSPPDPSPQLDLITSFTFEASHQLPHAPEHSKCRRLHGHSWKVEVHVTDVVDRETGWVMDYDEIKRACAPVCDSLDHRHLNDIDGLENPTSENLAHWVWQKLLPELPQLKKIVVKETCTSGCIYRGE